VNKEVHPGNACSGTFAQWFSLSGQLALLKLILCRLRVSAHSGIMVQLALSAEM